MTSNGLNRGYDLGGSGDNTIKRYRADCVLGRFKLGADIILEDKMGIEVLTWRWIWDELFGYELQRWVQILFIDEAGAIGDIFLKKRSLAHYRLLLKDLERRGESIQDGFVEMMMLPFISAINGEQYYDVHFAWSKRHSRERTEEIRRFLLEEYVREDLWRIAAIESQP